MQNVNRFNLSRDRFFNYNNLAPKNKKIAMPIPVVIAVCFLSALSGGMFVMGWLIVRKPRRNEIKIIITDKHMSEVEQIIKRVSLSSDENNINN